MAAPTTGQVAMGAVTLFVATTEKLKPGVLVKENVNAPPVSEAPPKVGGPTAYSQGFAPGDTVAATDRYDMIPGVRPLFQYAMNSKSIANENISLGGPTVLRMTMVAHASSFVLFSEVRNRSDETPFFPMGDPNQFLLATPHCYSTRFSARHGQGGLITFGDGHAAYFKYKYVVSDGTAVSPAGPTAGQLVPAGHDPGRPDLNWDCEGYPVIN